MYITDELAKLSLTVNLTLLHTAMIDDNHYFEILLDDFESL